MFAKAYRSKRLIYRDIENSDADKELMYKYGPANHATWGLLSGRLFKDVNMKSNSELLGKILESGLLLKVLICLPAPEEVLGDMSKLGPGDRGAKERQAAIPIGSLTLSLPSESFLHAPTTAVGLAIGEEFQSKVRSSTKINSTCEIGELRILTGRGLGIRQRSHKLGRGLGVPVRKHAQGGDLHTELQRQSHASVSEDRFQFRGQEA